MSLKPIRRALISVYDKTGLVDLGKSLAAKNIEILSTGSTAKTLREAGVPVMAVEEYTGFPEMMGGRVKTLHPRIHGGILADQSNPDHIAALKEQGIDTFDLIIINDFWLISEQIYSCLSNGVIFFKIFNKAGRMIMSAINKYTSFNLNG